MPQCWQTVISLAGRDKERFYAVVRADANFVYVCDGKLHTLSNPKRKNPKHIKNVNVYVGESSRGSDKALRKALAAIKADEVLRR